MKVLFLDQNKWIELAHAANDRGHMSRGVLDRLCLAVDQGELLCPLTISHIIETSKRNDPRSRADVAMIQARLSKGHVYRSRKARLIVETQRALQKAFGASVEERSKHWAIVPGFMQAFEPFDCAVAAPEQLRIAQLVNKHIDPEVQYFDFMVNQEDATRRTAIAKFEAGTRALLARIEERRAIMAGSPMDLRWRAYSARTFLDNQDFIIEMVGSIGRAFEEFEAIQADAIVQFMRDIPTFDVEAQLASRLESQTGHLEPNDIRDMLSFYTAVPYSDQLVAERNFISLARQAKLQAQYQVELYEKLESLPRT